MKVSEALDSDMLLPFNDPIRDSDFFFVGLRLLSLCMLVKFQDDSNLEFTGVMTLPKPSLVV